MKERPILFSAPMVRAILAGTKTQTRRILKPWKFVLPSADAGHFEYNGAALFQTTGLGTSIYPLFCPYGEAGDRLWIREAWAVDDSLDTVIGGDLQFDGRRPVRVHWMADGPKPDGFGRIRNARFLPSKAARILLEITDVRVQRLQQITEQDARAEGVAPAVFMASGERPRPEYRIGFEIIWNDINGRTSWDANPWVWAITFRRLP